MTSSSPTNVRNGVHELLRYDVIVAIVVIFAASPVVIAQERSKTHAQESVDRAAREDDSVFAAARDLLRAKWRLHVLRDDYGRRLALDKVNEKAEIPLPSQITVALAASELFKGPPVASGLDVTLNVSKEHKTIGPDPVFLRTYNRELVGPTLRVKRGDRLRVLVNNQLSPDTTGSGPHNTLHDYNTTNLHTHGLFVSPMQDDVLNPVLAGNSKQYEYDIEMDHPAGTFWYHAHWHGSVAGQVSSGMSGALIVDPTPGDGISDLEDVPQIKAALERIMVFQQIPYYDEGLAEGLIEQQYSGDQFGPGDWDRLERFTTINGVRLPVIESLPGSVERWRMIDSGFREQLKLRLVRVSGAGPSSILMHEIALDGIPTGMVRPLGQVDMWPGYRADVLVKMPDVVGEYLLIDERTPSGLVGGENRKYLAKLKVQGTLNSMNLATSAQVAACRPPSLTGTTPGPTVEYSVNGGGTLFQINGISYNPTNIRSLLLEDKEVWTAKAGVGTHPFHMHVNPIEVFSIVDSGGVERIVDRFGGPAWKDTIILISGETVKFRTHYKKFTGDFVQHCHILDHEDQGMMENVSIIDRVAPSPITAAFPPSEVVDESGTSRSLAEFASKPFVLILIQGSFCEHCYAQLLELAPELTKSGLPVVVVTPQTRESLPQLRELPFDIWADPKHSIFKSLGAFEEKPLHGTFVFDATGGRALAEVGKEPFMEVDRIIAAVKSVRGRNVTDCECHTPPTLSRVRKNIDCLTGHELKILKHAFEIVKKRSIIDPNDREGYAWQVRIHGDRRVGPCIHGSELIWPWHRAFLFYFEDMLRATDPNDPKLPTRDLTLPYWDWTQPASGIRGYPKAYEDSASPLHHAGRNVWGPSNPPPVYSMDDTGIRFKDWGLFGGSRTGKGKLEYLTHDDVHAAYVGDDMSNPAISVQDPIFWAHHANLDRLWDLWQQREGVNPSQQTAVLRGFSPTSVPQPIVSNFNDVRSQLKYDYCSPAVPMIVDLALPTPAPADSVARVVTLTFGPDDFNKVPSIESRVQLRLYGVTNPIRASYGARIFIHPASVPPKPDDASFVAKYYADRFNMLKMGSDGGQGHTTSPTHPSAVDVFIDITKRYEEVLNELRPGDRIAISFTFNLLEDGAPTTYGESEIEFKSIRVTKPPNTQQEDGGK